MDSKTQNDLEFIEKNPSTPPIATVIWLHGLGADGNDFAPVLPELKLPSTLPIRFIFPHAPMQAVTINNGYIMRAWYDIFSLGSHHDADEKGIQQSVHDINKLIIREEERGIPSERIILAGFSQGAAIALTVGLSFQKPLGGIIALSGYLPFAEKLFANPTSSANKQIPVFLGHGTEDTVVPFFLGETVRKMLNDLAYPVSWHTYAMAHSVCLQELKDIGEWIKSLLTK